MPYQGQQWQRWRTGRSHIVAAVGYYEVHLESSVTRLDQKLPGDHEGFAITEADNILSRSPKQGDLGQTNLQLSWDCVTAVQ